MKTKFLKLFSNDTQAVAEKLHNDLPELAFLRSHPPPEEEDLEELEGWMKSLNMNANMKSSKQIAETLRHLYEKTMKFGGIGIF